MISCVLTCHGTGYIIPKISTDIPSCCTLTSENKADTPKAWGAQPYLRIPKVCRTRPSNPQSPCLRASRDHGQPCTAFVHHKQTWDTIKQPDLLLPSIAAMKLSIYGATEGMNICLLLLCATIKNDGGTKVKFVSTLSYYLVEVVGQGPYRWKLPWNKPQKRSFLKEYQQQNYLMQSLTNHIYPSRSSHPNMRFWQILFLEY